MSRRPHTSKILAAALLLTLAPVSTLHSQHTTVLQPDATPPHRILLIIKDGNYQIVMSYKIVGNVVRYVSAIRGGAYESIHLSLASLADNMRYVQQSTQPRPFLPHTQHPTS